MKTRITGKSISVLLEQASRLIHASCFAEGLHPAKWTALRYFAEAPPRSRTIANLARFQGLTIGPVARTVQALVEQGLVERRENPQSKKAHLIILTRAGKAMLRKDPRSLLVGILDGLAEEEKEAFVDVMKTVLDGLLTANLPPIPDYDAEVDGDAVSEPEPSSGEGE